MSDETDRTTVALDRSTKDRLDDLAPPGSSWDARVSALLDDYERGVAETVEVRLDDEDRERLERIGDVATAEDLDGLREDLLGQLPGRTARELEGSFGRR